MSPQILQIFCTLVPFHDWEGKVDHNFNLRIARINWRSARIISPVRVEAPQQSQRKGTIGVTNMVVIFAYLSWVYFLVNAHSYIKLLWICILVSTTPAIYLSLCFFIGVANMVKYDSIITIIMCLFITENCPLSVLKVLSNCSVVSFWFLPHLQFTFIMFLPLQT